MPRAVAARRHPPSTSLSPSPTRATATLAIDADTQHTLPRHLGVLTHGIATLRDVLFDGLRVREAAVAVRPNLRLVPASLKLANADVALSQLAGSDLGPGRGRRHRLLRQW